MKEIIILTAQRAVSTAGTPEKVKEAPEANKNKVVAIRIRALAGNTGNIYITSTDQRATAATTGDILAPGEVYVLDVHDIPGAYINLAELWLDAGTSGDGVSYTAIEVQ